MYHYNFINYDNLKKSCIVSGQAVNTITRRVSTLIIKLTERGRHKFLVYRYR